LDIGVDVGGTFTDFAIYDEEGIRTYKTPTSFPDPLGGVLAGLKDLGVDMRSVRRFIHGTTIGTNAVLQRSGAKTAFLTTMGFRDHLEIGDYRRYTGGMFDPNWERTRPLVPMPLRFEIRERVAADGSVLVELDEENVLEVLGKLKGMDVEAVAVGFINSFRSPAHERRVGELIRDNLTGIPFSLSAETVAEWREFPRFSTTVVNSYLMPLIKGYVENLGAVLKSLGYDGEIFYMTSNSGVIPQQTAAAFPVRMVLSGPAAGVVGGAYLGGRIGKRNLITYDMGGTSTDVCLVQNLSPQISTKRVLMAFPLMIPMVDIHTVGAGSGSIVWVDRAGALRVGPQSAGAAPGPASYGRGGREFTITDANLLLGRLNPQGLLDGRMPLRRDPAEQAAQRLFARVGIEDVYELAEGAIRVAVTHMAGAIRAVSIERGHDTREFTLVAFGGAGPAHAIPIAEELGIPTVIVPKAPGNMCAFGLLTSDIRYDLVRTFNRQLGERDLASIEGQFTEVEEEAREAMSRAGIAKHEVVLQRFLSLRYFGQSWDLDVPVDAKRPTLAGLSEAFDARHLQEYGYNRPNHQLQVVNLRVVATAETSKPSSDQASDPLGATTIAPEWRPVHFDGLFRKCPIYRRQSLSDAVLNGPAIVEEFGSTTVVFPAWSVRKDTFGNLRLEKTNGHA
jgi:N-methylhydantoinase A